MLIKRGDLFYVDLSPTKGSEQKSRRPVLILQNDIGNEVSPTTIIAPLTTKSFTKEYPTNVHLPKGIAGLKENSTVLLSQIRTIDNSRLENKIGHLPESDMVKVDEAIRTSLGLA